MSQAFVICGVGHSGTRLLFKFIRNHPLVATPNNRNLWAFGEYLPAYYEIKKELYRRNNNPEIESDWNPIFENLDEYTSLCGYHKEKILIKIPTYPLFTPEIFVKYFGENTVFLYTMRCAEKILKSYEARGEVDYITDKFKLCRLSVKEPLDMQDILNQYDDRINTIKCHYNILKVDMLKMCADKFYFLDIFSNLNLLVNEDFVDKQLALVDKDRI